MKQKIFVKANFQFNQRVWF